MTDKQIIIDGVDCRYWFRPNPTDYRKCSLRGQDDNCDEIKDCFVKELLGKLAHKEQECEELKEERNEYFELMAIRTEVLAKIANKLGMNTGIIENKELFCKIDQLKAENDNLKSLIWWIHVGAEGADKATTEYYENRNTPYEENYWKRIRALQPPTYESKYKLALTEIKEIAEKGVKIHDDIIVSKQILQKIRECEGNDE